MEFDPDLFLKQADTLLGDESRALAENIARNTVESVRQQRNALEAGVNANKSKPDLADATGMDLAPQNERNLQASFENHLKAGFRQVAAALAQKFETMPFYMRMSLKPDASPEVITPEEHADDDHANLGPHPHSDELAVPIPPKLQSEAENAARLLKLTPKARAEWKRKVLEAKAQGLPPPPIP